MKITAGHQFLEWYNDYVKEYGCSPSDYDVNYFWKHRFLHIEKEHIIDAYKQAEDMYEFFEYEHRYGREYLTAEPYYNKTFKNNESN